MQLNQGQNDAAEAVFNFLMSDDKEFIVSGPAGVGKTTLMKYIVTNIMKRYKDTCDILNVPHEIDGIHISATTNKAADVLELATGYPTSTIHQLMNLKVYNDYSSGKTKITKIPKNWMVHSKKIIFIDEAPMIDKAVRDFILEGTDEFCKIIYIGDHCQMAPIFEDISPIYVTPKHYAELTVPIRNADSPPLMDLCNQLRETVETGIFKPIKEVKGSIDFINLTQLKQILKDDFINSDIDSRILCFTNKRVKEYNDQIRKIRQLPDTFQVGEKLINSKNLIRPDGSIKVEQEIEIISILSSPKEIVIHEKTTMSVYDAIIETKNGFRYKLQIPTNPTHYQKLLNYYQELGKRTSKWKAYFNLKDNFPDLRPKDASTVYKAQGSTYNGVILDLGNIGTSNDADQVARMLYVGATRPRKHIYMFGELPEKYRGN